MCMYWMHIYTRNNAPNITHVYAYVCIPKSCPACSAGEARSDGCWNAVV